VCESLNLSIGCIHGVSIYFCTCWFICKTGFALSCFKISWFLLLSSSMYFAIFYLTLWGWGHLNCLNARSWGF
jgi:hypothetical protein